MLKKVTDDFAEPDGEALVEQCVTSVTTGRIDGRDRRGRGRLAIATAAARKAAAPSARPASPRRRSRPPQLATLVDAVPSGPDWLFEYKYDGYRLLLADRRRRGDRLDPQRQGLERQVPRASSRPPSDLPAGCLIDGEAVALGKNGKPDFQLAAGEPQGRRRRPRFLRLRPARRPGRGHHRPAQSRAQGAARRAAQGRRPRRSSTATMSSPRARRCSTRSARKAARGSSPRKPRRPIAARAPRTGSRSNASSARNSSSSAGRRATSAAASARSTSPFATAGN